VNQVHVHRPAAWLVYHEVTIGFVEVAVLVRLPLEEVLNAAGRGGGDPDFAVQVGPDGAGEGEGVPHPQHRARLDTLWGYEDVNL